MYVKNSLFLLCSFLFSMHINSQIRFNHRLKPDDVVKWFKLVAPPDPGCTSTPDTLITKGSNQLIIKGRQCVSQVVDLCRMVKGVIYVSGGKVFFDPWKNTRTCPYKNELQPSTRLPLELKEGRDSISAPNKILIVGFRTWTIGLNSIPFRYRSKRILADTLKANGTVTSSFNLAIHAGRTWGYSCITKRGINNYSFTAGLFGGASSFEMNKEVSDDPMSVIRTQTNASLSYGVLTVFARDNIGLLFALGFDHGYGKNADSWIYQDKPWISFGLATSLTR